MLYLIPPQVKARTMEAQENDGEGLNLKGGPLLQATGQLTLLLSVVWGLLLSCL